RGMKLKELHILQGQAVTIHGGGAITCEGEGVRGHFEHAAEAARGDQYGFGMEGMELAGGDLDRDDSTAGPVDHDQVEHVVFVEERHALLDALLVEGLKDHVP